MPASDPDKVRVKIWGARGSVPTPGPGTVRYGGNTSCVEVTWGESGRIIFDAGTGIRLLGEQLSLGGSPPKRIDIVFSHLHWDHIQGLPFFIPMYVSGVEIHLWGGGGKGFTLDRMMDHQLHSSFFPIGRASLSAELVFHLIGPGEFDLPGCRLKVCAINHPGGCYAYRLEVAGKSIVYATDNERTIDEELDDYAKELSLIEMASGADILIHDAQYTIDEYQNFRRGWGHSTFQDAAEVARSAGINRLVLFHHDPSHNDSFLETQENILRADYTDIEEIVMASELLTLDI